MRFFKPENLIISSLLCVIVNGLGASVLDDLSDACSLYEQGSEAALHDQNDIALKAFEKALKNLRSIKERYPKWRRKIIDRRIGMCERRIESLRGKLAAEAFPTPAPVISGDSSVGGKEDAVFPESSPGGIAAKVGAMERELERTKIKYQDALNEIARMRGDIEAAERTQAKIEELIKDNDQLTRRNALLKLDIDDLRRKAAQGGGEWKAKFDNERLNSAALKEERRELFDECAKIKAEKDEVGREKVKLEFELKQAAETAAGLKGQLIAAQDKLKKFQDDKGRVDDTIPALERELAGLKKKLAEKTGECDELANQLTKIEDKIPLDQATREIKAENELLRKELTGLNALVAQSKKALADAENGLARQTAENKKISDTLALVAAGKKALEADLAQIRQHGDDSAKSAIEAKDKIKKLEADNAQLLADLKTLSDKFDANRGSAKKLEALETKFFKLEADKKKCDKELADISIVKVQLENDLAQKSAGLEKTGAELKKAQAANTELQRQAVELKAGLAAAEKALKKERLNVDTKAKATVELDNKIKSLEKSLAAAEKLVAKSGEKAVGIQKELDKTKVTLTMKTAKLDESEAMVAKLKARLKDLEAETGDAKIKALEDRVKTLAADLNAKTAALKKTAQEATDAREDLKTTVKKLDTANNDLTRAAGDVKARDADIEKLRRSMAKLEDEVKQQRAAKDKQTKALTEAENNLKKQREAMKATEAELKKLRAVNAELESDKKKLAAAIPAVAAAPEPKKPQSQAEMIEFLLSSGIANENAGDVEAAAWHYNKALSMRAEHPAALMGLARTTIKRDKKKVDEAAGFYDRAVKAGAKPDPELEKLIKK